MPDNKYISVITNFGCHYSCPYCITKNNYIQVPKTTIEGLSELRNAIAENNCNVVSVSGGGDPLYQIEDHMDWYNALFDTVPMNVKLELHTSYAKTADICKFGFLSNFFRVVYHLHRLSDLLKIQKQSDIVRVVFVVDENMRRSDIDFIYDFVQQSDDIDELSFRQMVDKDYVTTYHHYDYLQSGHAAGKWHYIEQADYNLYYAENKVYTRFKDFMNPIMTDFLKSSRR